MAAYDDTSEDATLKYDRQASQFTVQSHDSEYDTLHLPPTDAEGIGRALEVDEADDKPTNFIRNVTMLEMPFKSLHNKPQSFKSCGLNVFIPHLDVIVNIINVKRHSSNFLNPNLYIIHLQHGSFEWIIKKRYKHFHRLHQQLQLFRTALKIPIPTKRHRERRKTLLGDYSKKNLPRLPNRSEARVPPEKVEHRAQQLEQYLINLLNIPLYKYHNATLEFLDISPLSFVGSLGMKGKEGLVKKRSGGHRVHHGCLLVHRVFWDWCSQWKKRWLIVKDSFVAYVRPSDGCIKAVLLMDHQFEVKCGVLYTGIHHGLLISNATRHLLLKSWTKRKARDWEEYLTTVAKTTAQDYTKPNRYGSFAPVRYNSDCRWFIDGATYMEAVADALESAKEEIYISDWWLSPEIYMKRPALDGETWRLDRILHRKSKQGVKIYILLYKEVELALGINSIYSKQKLVFGHHENIKVLRHPDHAPGGILLWAHHEKIVCIDQTFAFLGGIDLCYGRWDDYYHRLTDLGFHINNDKPKVTFTSSTPRGTPALARKRNYSSASESDSTNFKLNKSGSTGLLNSSFFRRSFVKRQRSWSESNLFSFDYFIQLVTGSFISNNEISSSPEEDFKNMVLDFYVSHSTALHAPKHVCNSLKIHQPLWLEILKTLKVDENVNNNTHEQVILPNNNFDDDVALNAKTAQENIISSESEEDCPDGYFDRVNYSKSKKKLRKLKGEAKEAKKRVARKLQRMKSMKRHKSLESLDSINSLNIGIQDIKISRLDVPYSDVERTDSEKAVSDLGVVGATKLWYGKDYCNFIVKDLVSLNDPYQDLIDRHVTPRMPWHDIGVMVVGNPARDVARHFIQRWNFTKLEKAKYHNNYPWLLPKASYKGSPTHLPFTKDKMFCCSCQILRSVGQWSAGVKYTEESIHNAYVDAIQSAQHFIYIENQFFITQPNSCKDVTNEIADALYNRIVKAHRDNEVFRVYVVMPLLPAFEGEIGTTKGTAIEAITHWNYASICRGEGSLLQRLALEVGDPTQYISFYGLRTHDVLNEELVTELIYVHSKMMIVDDIKVIIGSANINDRSLIGKRDSEIAVIINDSDTEKSIMNGKEFDAGRMVGSLRRTLFREHLGLLKNDDNTIDVRDPISEHFFKNVWIKTAATNTSIYEKVFNCIPSDKVHSYAKLKAFQAEVTLSSSDPKKSKELLKKAKGSLVLMPLHFLCMENLTPPVTSKEILMPTCLWT